MADALALPSLLQVNACGRLVDVSSDSANSLHLVRRELVQKLRVSNAATLQLSDAAGRVLRTDADLAQAFQDDLVPLQAKLTLAALHDIEQKKVEGRCKEHDMVGLQWQIIIEQVANFGNELTNVAAELHSMHDDSRRIVQEFENQEKLRREAIMSAIKDETAERECMQRDIYAKLEEVVQMVAEERSVREVADYQLSKRSEQVENDLLTAQSSQSQELATLERTLATLRHDLELETQKSGASWNRNLESLKQLEIQDKQLAHVTATHQSKLGGLEQHIEKLRGDVDRLELGSVKQMQEMRSSMKRHDEELERTTKEATFARTHQIACAEMDNVTSLQALETVMRQLREELAGSFTELAERTKLLETRTATVEKDVEERWVTQSCMDNDVMDKITKAGCEMHTSKLERAAIDAVTRVHSAKVDELLNRVREMEGSVNVKADSQYLHGQLENMATLLQNQELRTSQLQRDFQEKLAMEGSRHDQMMSHFHETVKAHFAGAAFPTPALRDSREIRASMDSTNSKDNEDNAESSQLSVPKEPRRFISAGNEAAMSGYIQRSPSPSPVLRPSGVPAPLLTKSNVVQGSYSSFQILPRSYNGSLQLEGAPRPVSPLRSPPLSKAGSTTNLAYVGSTATTATSVAMGMQSWSFPAKVVSPSSSLHRGPITPASSSTFGGQ
eukprot:TRINITY_DN80135_c0_g1_i1.p1 TRINITY_DN80135_c0_g1~~TRINITY_DN80135_c0_g1_i1.p1  ORF type:complete len:674 (-),score=197.68 TRINITY_DN80135_c0_g1_i1:235-2256(-)